MTRQYMGTMPRVRQSIELVNILQWFIDQDCHKWIIGKEEGLKGYKHWQMRFTSALKFDELKEVFPYANCHFEECSDTWSYERKEGNYYSSDDNLRILSNRFGKLRENQSRILGKVSEQSDRGITVVIDDRGNTGKSWLCRHIWQQGTGYYVPPVLSSVKEIIQFVCSGYNGEDIIVIDIPRSWKWSKELIAGLECIKDGLIFDTRYSARTRLISANVLVFTNVVPKLDTLSVDRWDLLNAEGAPYS